MDDGGGGKVEEIVGQAIEGRRDEVFLVSKVLPQNAPREGTIAACERSLRRLRTDHLDVYLLHWPGPHPLGDTIAGFEDLKHEGKILHYGVSNFGFPLLEKAIAIAGENAIACNQVSYHLKDREIEFGVIPFCEERRIALVGYSPFGQGDFPGDNPHSRGDRPAGRRHSSPDRTGLLASVSSLLRHTEVLDDLPRRGKRCRR